MWIESGRGSPRGLGNLSLAFFNQGIAGALYVIVALMWPIPDRRIERTLEERRAREHESGDSV